ncbi:hypothetical protein [Phytomonospora endophytica]|uniref:Uncharacterized protein n=1 Tax=Phytomonospora endophytica TaxID=714109 RepID=A0A841FEF4_9ACTN|nr:hypothetical protein [Phytomonospora endophytica]MBB6033915.1 hypothetical protein [Phytomonospora endophytica]GIG64563.1 hypothetical protein Pen01_08580 [Phytomonospora endophytica]
MTVFTVAGEVSAREVDVISLPVDVGNGVDLGYDWGAVPGTDAAEVTAAALTITSAPGEESLSLPVTADGDGLIITPPAHVDVKTLTLVGLYRLDGEDKITVRSEADLAGRLAVRVEPATGGGFAAPAYSVPPVWGHDLIPATLTGASMGYSPYPALRLPTGLRAKRLRLSLVTGDTPEEFEERPFGVDRIQGLLVRPPRDLTVTGPGGTKVLDVPGETPAGRRFDVDLTPEAQKLLSTALAAGQPLTGAFTVRGAAGSKVRLTGGKVHGDLIRSFPGVRGTTLRGEAVVPAEFAATVPGDVRGDLTVAYLGLRVHTEPSDAFPAQQGGIAGPVLTPDGLPVTRAFPPAGIGQHPLALVGLIGRATGDCAITLTVTRPNGEPLGPAAQAQVPAAERVGTTWITLPAPVTVTEPAALTVTVTRGRFLWAAGDRPLARLVIADPAPPATPVTLGATVLAAVDADGIHLPAHPLPPNLAAGAPLASDLFVQVDLSDVVMRYRR